MEEQALEMHYRIITDEYFDPDYFLSSVDISSEHKILDLKNKLEASVVIWKRKMTAKDNKSSWGSAVSLEKREIFEDRAETILLILKHRFPGLPQSDLDISKIQCNRVRTALSCQSCATAKIYDFVQEIHVFLSLQDVGQAVLESYSRIIESLAFTVLSRIEDVMHADNLARNPTNAEQKKASIKEPSPIKTPEKSPNDKEENTAQTPTSMTLLDFMGWNLDSGDTEAKQDAQDDAAAKHNKAPNIDTNKTTNYIDRLENLGSLRSPTERD
ncbi:UNVERIFIED_CONTAM: Rho guanine nucleotide exchange factor 8 [Sesamum angustifolium]|uniref:Rho guanine nucleotide exchange factor 8 n=1 Tax=Sesamum angustifolium TaxID=2727405 RepID=A0AAW2RK93_9LAMI